MLLVNVNCGPGLRLGKYTFSVRSYTNVGTNFNFWLGPSSAGINFSDIEGSASAQVSETEIQNAIKIVSENKILIGKIFKKAGQSI